MKRTPFLRKTPLARGSVLARVSPRRTAKAGSGRRLWSTFDPSRYVPTVPGAIRQALIARSGGRCEMALIGCGGLATDPCHRIRRGMGGRHGPAKVANNRLANLLWGCRRCHGWTHARPDEAYELGLMLREYQDPSAEPVVYRGDLVFLADSGAVVPFADGVRTSRRPEAAA